MVEQVLHEHCSRQITYRRGTLACVLNATIDSTNHQIEVAEGVIDTWESRDYLIRPQDFFLDGVRAEPRRGDRIQEQLGGKTCVYEVVGPGDGPHWRWSDNFRVKMRVHTKLVQD